MADTTIGRAVTAIIADVLDAHHYTGISTDEGYRFEHCACGHRFEGYNVHRHHAAAVLVETLGLTQEWAAGSLTPGESAYHVVDGSRGPSRENAARCLFLPRFHLISRWVTRWERTP